MVNYDVSFQPRTGAKEISWKTEPDRYSDFPTLAHIQEAAAKEFPGVPAQDLLIDALGYDAEIIVLKQKPTAS